jgi:hypothetical protein
MMAKRTSLTVLAVLMVSFCLAGLDTVLIPRVSYVDGEVSLQESGKKNWDRVDVNLPLQQQDRLRVERDSRLEIEVDDGSVIRLNEWSILTLSSLGEKDVRLDMPSGQMILRTEGGADYLVATPAGQVAFDDNGLYRINSRPDDQVEVLVYYGKAEWRHESRKEKIERSQRLVISREYQAERAAMSDEDPFDVWSRKRDERYVTSKAHRYLPNRNITAGAADLGIFGNWHYVSSYGYCWSPMGVSAGWAPYRDGYWRYTNRWGWTWVSSDPWGWLPYHYGRWFRHPHFGWLWYPDAYWGSAFWSPALVRFSFGGGYVGWVPLAPGEAYRPQQPERQEAVRILADNLRLGLLPGSPALPRPDGPEPTGDIMIPADGRVGGVMDTTARNAQGSVGLTYQALADFRSGRAIRSGSDNQDTDRRSPSVDLFRLQAGIARDLFPERDDGRRGPGDDSNAGQGNRTRSARDGYVRAGLDPGAGDSGATDDSSVRDGRRTDGTQRARSRAATGEAGGVMTRTRRSSTGTATDSMATATRDRFRTRSLNLSRGGDQRNSGGYADRVFLRTALTRSVSGRSGGGYSSGGYYRGRTWSGSSSGVAVIRSSGTIQRSSSGIGSSGSTTTRSSSSSSRTNERK